MNYIRTEKGVYEFTDEMCVNKFGHIAYKDRPFICIYGVGNNVIKQADTIEELCDEFVIEFEGCVPFTSDIFYIDEEHRKDELKPLAEYYKGCKNIYAAIWTDKGLIYVAKMNDKGEFELI